MNITLHANPHCDLTIYIFIYIYTVAPVALAAPVTAVAHVAPVAPVTLVAPGFCGHIYLHIYIQI